MIFGQLLFSLLEKIDKGAWVKGMKLKHSVFSTELVEVLPINNLTGSFGMSGIMLTAAIAPDRSVSCLTEEGIMGSRHQKRIEWAKGVDIAIALRNTPLDMLAMAVTERGLCLIQFGDNAHTLLCALHIEFPKANIRTFLEAPQSPSSIAA